MYAYLILPLAALMALSGNIEHLGQPCRAKNILSGQMVIDRQSGREVLVLCNTNEYSHMELIFLDFERNTAKVYPAPAGAGAWALIEVPSDRLIVGTHYDGMFMVFDLKKMEFVKTVKFPGESYIWNFAVGSDGRIYGGTYSGGKLGALNLDNYEVEDFGNPVPPNLYLRQVSALPDGRILCSFGEEKPTTLIFDPKTKRFEPVPEQLRGVAYGITWDEYFLSGNKVFRGSSLDLVQAPFPTPPPDKGTWYVDTRLTNGDTVYIRQGNAIYRWSKGAKELTLVADIALRGGALMAATRDGKIVGVRGQDYFVIKTGDKAIRPVPIPAVSSPRPTLFLEADGQGRLWGGPHFGQTLFYLDIASKRAVNTSNISSHGGEVYDVAFYKNRVYAVAYVGGEIIRYEPDKPWDQWNNKNPRSIAKLNSSGYIRPIGGIVLGPDGKLYSGWMAQYGKYGGAVAITDPETEQTEIIENPLGEQAIQGVVPAERYIYVGTSLAGNGLPNKRDERPRLGVIASSTKKVVWQMDFEGSNVRPFAYDPKSRRLAVAINGNVKLFDTVKREFVSCGELPSLTSHSFSATQDGIVYYGSSNLVVALNLRDGKSAEIAESPGAVSAVTVDSKGNVYFASGVDVYRCVQDQNQRRDP